MTLCFGFETFSSGLAAIIGPPIITGVYCARYLLETHLFWLVKSFTLFGFLGGLAFLNLAT